MTVMIERPEFAMLNGALVPFAEARISVMAPGLTFAVAVFEGVRAYWNAEHEQLYVFRMGEHLDRLRFSMRVIELDGELPGACFDAQVPALLRANAMREDVYVRLQTYVDDWGEMVATGPVGSSVVCRRRPRVAAFTSGMHFAVSSWRRNADDASPPRIKATANYLNSRLAALEAKRHGFDSAVILNRDGSVSEGPGGCLFMVRDGELITPPVSAGILESITRDTLVVLAREQGLAMIERDIGRTELYRADELFYCGTGQELVPVLSVDRKAVGGGATGDITRELQRRYDALVRGNLDAHRDWLTPVYDGIPQA
jgi:branched-chain amino acid aminotransferase